MSDETLRTLITCGTTIFVALISNILVFAISKINNRNANENNILQKQYDNLFMPIHRVLYFSDSNDPNDDNKISQIRNIIYNNYNLSTDFLRNEFLDCVMCKKISLNFRSAIESGCLCLEKNLGYTRTKLSKQQKEFSNVILQSKKRYSKSYLISIISTLISIITLLAIIFIFTLWK